MNLTKTHSIVPNGSRTSSSMNDALEEMFYNLSTVNDNAYNINETMTRFMKRTLLQQQVLAKAVENSNYELALNSSDNTILLSAYDLVDNSTYIIDTLTDVKHWREYGVITTDIVEVPSNQFTVADTRGNKWVPRTTKLEYAISTSGAIPSSFIPENDATNLSAAFDEKSTSAWFKDLTNEPASDLHVWVKATLPAEYLYQTTANTIVIHPEPMLGARLLGVRYTDSSGEKDIQLPWNNYIPETGRQCMNEMFLVPSSRISDVTFHFIVPSGIADASLRALYISHIGVYNTKFKDTGTMVLKNNPGTVALLSSGHSVNNHTGSATNKPIPIANTTTDKLAITLSSHGYGNVPDNIRDITCAIQLVQIS